MFIFFGWLIFSFVVGFIGNSRKIGFAGAFFISLLLSPIIGLLFVLVSKDKKDEEFKKQMLENQKMQIDANKKQQNNLSISDELSKLQKLKDDNIISLNEFNILKSNLLKDSTNTHNIVRDNNNLSSGDLSSGDLSDKKIIDDVINLDNKTQFTGFTEMHGKKQDNKSNIKESTNLIIIYISIFVMSVLFTCFSFNNKSTIEQTPTENIQTETQNKNINYKFILTHCLGKKLNKKAYLTTDLLAESFKLDFRDGNVIRYKIISGNKYNPMCEINTIDTYGDNCEICIIINGNNCTINFKYKVGTMVYTGYVEKN